MRSRALQDFLDQMDRALATATDGCSAEVARQAKARWAKPGTAPQQHPGRLAVCDWIAPALDLARGTGREGLAQAFAAVEGRLAWRRRPSARPEDGVFWNGHANAEILGPNGLERRNDVWLGVTLMAPGVDYPTHSHPPAEIYLALTPGEWWNADMDWTDPGLAGCIHNPPGIAHAMRSGTTPFLAFWALPL